LDYRLWSAGQRRKVRAAKILRGLAQRSELVLRRIIHTMERPIRPVGGLENAVLEIERRLAFDVARVTRHVIILSVHVPPAHRRVMVLSADDKRVPRLPAPQMDPRA